MTKGERGTREVFGIFRVLRLKKNFFLDTACPIGHEAALRPFRKGSKFATYGPIGLFL